MHSAEQHDELFLGKARTNSYAAWNRPQSSTEREEEQLMQRSTRKLSQTTDPAEKLQLMCLSRGAGGIMGLGRVLRKMASQDNQELNRNQFFKALKKTDLNLNDEDAEMLFEKFDPGNTGRIDIGDFLAQIRPPMSDARRTIVQQVFMKLDRTGDGLVTLDDLRHAYCVKDNPRYKSGEESANHLLDEFLNNFEQEDGQVTLEEFMDFYSGLGAAIDTDCYFDLMMRQSYKL